MNFGVTAATSFTVNSATQITSTAPAGTGTADVTVTTAGGTSSTTVVDRFSYGPTANLVIAAKSLTKSNPASFTPVTPLGGTSPFTYTVSPALPTGLTMASDTGTITGTPTAASAQSNYGVTITDHNGQLAQASFSLTVNSAVTATQAVATESLTQNRVAPSFTPVTGSGGTTPLRYSISPSLPAGLTISSITGTISGSPTATIAATTFTVTVTDANGALATAGFSLSVITPLTAAAKQNRGL